MMKRIVTSERKSRAFNHTCALNVKGGIVGWLKPTLRGEMAGEKDHSGTLNPNLRDPPFLRVDDFLFGTVSGDFHLESFRICRDQFSADAVF